MKVTITGPVTHRCPFVAEVDVGEFTLTYSSDDLIELHDLRTRIAGFHDQAITHEQLTGELAAMYPQAAVSTRWVTAGMHVEVFG